MDIIKELFSLQDLKYRDFMAPIIPSVPVEKIIGVRTPQLRELSKKIIRSGEADNVLSSLPHTYFEENQLHSFILCALKDFESCIRGVDSFLPYADNWATTDQMSPAVFKKHRKELLPFIEKWINSGRTYTVRYAVLMLMQHFLDEDFDPVYLRRVSEIHSDEYYVNMMLSWYFATALAKQYDEAVRYVEEGKLPRFVHLKTIQKALESYRIPQERKDYLKTLRHLDK